MPKQFYKGRNIFSTNDDGSTGYLCGKKINSEPCTTSNLKWIIILSSKPKIITF